MVPIITPAQFNPKSIESDDPWVTSELVEEQTPFTVQAGIQAAACVLGIFLGTALFWMGKALVPTI
jgi:hypothetical protein